MKRNFQKRRKSGSVLVLSLIFTFVMSVSVGALLRYQIAYHKINSRVFDRTRAIQDAESAVQIVLYTLKYDSDPTTGWTNWSQHPDPPGSDGNYTYTDPVSGKQYQINLSFEVES